MTGRGDQQEDEEGDDWHAEGCPLFEVAPEDCAYDVTACVCGYEGRK